MNASRGKKGLKMKELAEATGLPKSTLLALVGAFAGLETTLAAYRHAVENQYRFYSYGDAMLII